LTSRQKRFTMNSYITLTHQHLHHTEFYGIFSTYVYYLAPFTRHYRNNELFLSYMPKHFQEQKTAHAIRRRIEKAGPGCLWRPKDFPDFPARTVAKTLTRLSQRGVLTKINRGTYFFGKETPLGRTMPQASDVADKLFASKFTGGLHAYYNLGLTRQVPATLTIVSPSRNHIQKTKTIRRNIMHLKNASDQEFWILETLRNIKNIPDCPPHTAIAKIMDFIIKNNIETKRLIRFAMHEPPRVRALLGAISQDLGTPPDMLIPLKKSLNQLTLFKIGVLAVLKHAKEWNIE